MLLVGAGGHVCDAKCARLRAYVGQPECFPQFPRFCITARKSSLRFQQYFRVCAMPVDLLGGGEEKSFIKDLKKEANLLSLSCACALSLTDHSQSVDLGS
jgi:hypothetical protein